MIGHSRRRPTARRITAVAASTVLLALVSAAPLAAQGETLAETVAGDFATYCLDIASNPDDVRSAARAAGLARVPDGKLEMVMPVPGEAWVIRETGPMSILTLNTEGGCAIRFSGVPVADVRSVAEASFELLGPGEGRRNPDPERLYAVNHEGRIGTMFVVEHVRESGTPGSLNFIPVEVFERKGMHRMARWVRQQFEPAKALAGDFTELCINAEGDADAVDAAVRFLGWARMPEERVRTVLKSPGLAWESTGRPFGAVLELPGDDRCRIDFQGVLVAEMPAVLEHTMQLRLLDEKQRDGRRTWLFATNRRSRIGSLTIVEYAGRNGKVGALMYAPVEVFERKGDQEVVRWLRQQFEQ